VICLFFSVGTVLAVSKGTTTEDQKVKGFNPDGIQHLHCTSMPKFRWITQMCEVWGSNLFFHINETA